MKKLSFALVIVWGMSMLLPYNSAAADAAKIAIVPQPQEMKAGTGSFEVKSATAIVVDKDSPDATNVGKQLAERLRTGTGMELKVSTADGSAKPTNAIRITTAGADASLGAEGYRLTVTPDGVTIAGGGGPGMFYGMQTLLQLLPPQVFGSAKADASVAWTVPAVEIKDQPRFQWRGLLLDVSRHFVNKQEIENFLDLMAQHKLNTFHWHLTDDNGWRAEIKKYPKLTEIAAWRDGIDFGLDPKAGTAYNKDGKYGGFYTQDEMREIVAYAKARYITIVPEIEMPGHCWSAISVYPELGCIGVKSNAYCPGNDEAFTFVENVLTEIMDIFPSKLIHIGGDEVEKGNWTKCEKCQARIKKENLKDVNELQSYFIKRVEKFLNEKGRTLIGWDEILEGGLAPNATVMSWRSVEGGITAANAGHDVVMTPVTHCYLDYYQAKTGEPKAIGGFVPLQKTYSFEPVAANIAPDKAKHVLGAAGNLWSEFFPNYAHVQYMGYPRACAIAEVTWTDPKLKNWDDFKSRMETQFQRLKAQGVNYRAPKPGVDPGY